MRTTVVLDADNAARLRAVAEERNVPFGVALNDAIRAGLAAGGGPAQPYMVPTRPLRAREGVDLTRALQLAAELEDDAIESSTSVA